MKLPTVTHITSGDEQILVHALIRPRDDVRTTVSVGIVDHVWADVCTHCIESSASAAIRRLDISMSWPATAAEIRGIRHD